MLFLLTGFSQKLKLGKTHGILITLFYVILFSSHRQKICCPYWKTRKIITPQYLIIGNTLNLAWQRMLGHFPKIPSHKTISESPA